MRNQTTLNKLDPMISDEELESYIDESLDGEIDRYRLDIDHEENDLIISLTYFESESPPFIGSELDEILDYQSFTFTGDLDSEEYQACSTTYTFHL